MGYTKSEGRGSNSAAENKVGILFITGQRNVHFSPLLQARCSKQLLTSLLPDEVLGAAGHDYKAASEHAACTAYNGPFAS